MKNTYFAGKTEEGHRIIFCKETNSLAIETEGDIVCSEQNEVEICSKEILLNTLIKVIYLVLDEENYATAEYNIILEWCNEKELKRYLYNSSGLFNWVAIKEI